MLFALLITLAPDSVPAAAASSLAESLYNHCYFDAAAVEYGRALAVSGDNRAQIGMLRYQQALAAAAAGNRTEARRTAAWDTTVPSNLRHRLALATAGLALRVGAADEALMTVEQSLMDQRDTAIRARLLYAEAWLEMQGLELERAAWSFEQANRPDMARAVRDARAQSDRRSPTAALAMSALVPGLGEAYAGRPARGIITLLTVVASAAGAFWAAKSGDWVMAAGVAGTFWIRFHDGAVRNAVRQAEEFNTTRLRLRLEQKHIAEPDWFGNDTVLARACARDSN